MTDVPGATGGGDAVAITPQEVEYMKKMYECFLQFSEMKRRQEGGASSSNINAPEKDKKTPKRKTKQSNKKVESLKKKEADERAKHLKTLKELKEVRLLAAIERREKLAEKRKSLLEKDEEFIKSLREKMNKKAD